VIGLTQAARAAGLAVVLAGAATPAFAVHDNGFQVVADFEEFAPGKTTIYYAGIDTYIKGGTVTAGGGFTPHSGANVYVGTNISTMQTNGDFNFQGVDYWPQLSAYVSPGADTVFVNFYGYDPDTKLLSVIGSTQTVGQDANQYVVFDDYPAGKPWLLTMSFTSASSFAVDDLGFGHPDIPPGVPEPGTWALMIVGFGATGAALRRRVAIA
jgi:hypothetical protein